MPNGLKVFYKAQIAFIGIELYLFFRKHVDIKHENKRLPVIRLPNGMVIILFILRHV